MKILAKGRTANSQFFAKNDPNLPEISVLMAVFNEEKVISEKLESLKSIDYPADKLRIFIGSDGSTDATNELILSFQKNHSTINFFPFLTRRGKPPVINQLAEITTKQCPAAHNHLFLFTDASVMLAPTTVFELAKNFKNSKIGVVDAQIFGTGLRTKGISTTEKQYMHREIALKNDESQALGMMMGPFGGCFAVRSDLFEPVPPNSLVDDFWITMRVLERGFFAISEPAARCTEGATHLILEEYRRKTRIAAGSFQNLFRFKKWVLPPTSRLGWVFFSHKVLRWFGGFMLVAAWISAGILAQKIAVFQYIFGLLSISFLGIPALFFIANSLNISILGVRSLTYFFAMNIALMHGFFRFLNGIKTNIWTPTKRY